MDTQKPDQAAPGNAASGQLCFPIVGIGASAGGFPALATLLQNMPATPGMALVVIMHLPPHERSNADRVLQSSASLPVVQVNHTMPILPNQVYVIPPAHSLKMMHDSLVLDDLDRPGDDPTTIDIFFRTLATAHKEAAIGVVLSGMGSDGTAGLACIKEKGGVTIAQLPTDAEESSMPQSAIESGMADFVLTAAQIPAKLVELRNIIRTIRQRARQGHAPAEVAFDMGPDPQEMLHGVLSLLRDRTGHDFRHYKQPTLLRRLERRLQVRGMPDLPSYRDLLLRDASESRALLKDLLIGVTQFFRDPEAFAALERTVLPDLFRVKESGDEVRVWVAACSTGEEAYSVAMLLADQAAAMAHPPRIQVFATDIDAHAIRAARAGLYPASIVDDVPAERLQRYFTMENGGYKVRKILRDRVLLAEHNLLHDPAFSQLDLVTCRNFLIYLNREMHRHVLGMFHFALKPGCYLMLGNAESADDTPHLFTPITAAQRLYQARPATGATYRAQVKTTERIAPFEPDEVPPTARRGRLFSFADIHMMKTAELAPPSILVNGDAEIIHIEERASAFLRHRGGEPTRDIVALVAPELRLELRTALFQAQKSGRLASTGPVGYAQESGCRLVEMTVLPFHDQHAEGLLMLVTFRKVHDVPAQALPVPAETRDQPLLHRLDDELQETRRRLQDTIDQAETSTAELRTGKEELQSTVEELRSTNTELQIENATLRSTNEEMKTVIQELQLGRDAAAKAHDDLSNLIASSDVATLFLDRAMRILRYTPRIADLFNVIPADVGRPIMHFTNKLDHPRLAEEAARVFETLQPMEQEVRSKDGRYYIVRVRPYRTSEDRIEGAVMTFFDITGRRAAEQAIRENEQRQAFLVKLGDALRKSGNPPEAQRAATRMLGEHLGVNRVFYAEINGGDYAIPEDHFESGVPALPSGRYPAKEFGPWLTSSFHDAQTSVIDDARSDPRISPAERQSFAQIQCVGLVAVPLIKQGRLVSLLGVHSAAPRDWSAGEVALIEETAERAWTTVEQARAEHALSASEEKYRTLSNTAPALIWQNDDTGGNLFVNQYFLDFSGETAEALRGTGWHGIVHPDDARSYIGGYLDAVREHRVSRTHGRLRRHDGQWRWFDSFAQPLFRADGRFAGHVGVSLDINDLTAAREALSESKRVEAMIRRSETRFRALVTATSSVVYRMSPDWSEMRELDGQGFISDTSAPSTEWLDKYILPEDQPTVLAAIEDARRRKAMFKLEHRVRRADGLVGWTMSRAVPLLDDAGEIVEWFGAAIDITGDKDRAAPSAQA